MTVQGLRKTFGFYSRFRWIGVVLFAVAVPFPLVAVYTAAARGGHWGWILPSIGCMGLSLGAFGTSNDTAIHAARELAKRGAAHASAAELAHEERVRPKRLLAVHASPKAALIFPILAAALMAYMGHLLAGAASA